MGRGSARVAESDPPREVILRARASGLRGEESLRATAHVDARCPPRGTARPICGWPAKRQRIDDGSAQCAMAPARMAAGSPEAQLVGGCNSAGGPVLPPGGGAGRCLAQHRLFVRRRFVGRPRGASSGSVAFDRLDPAQAAHCGNRQCRSFGGDYAQALTGRVARPAFPAPRARAEPGSRRPSARRQESFRLLVALAGLARIAAQCMLGRENYLVQRSRPCSRMSSGSCPMTFREGIGGSSGTAVLRA